MRVTFIGLVSLMCLPEQSGRISQIADWECWPVRMPSVSRRAVWNWQCRRTKCWKTIIKYIPHGESSLSPIFYQYTSHRYFRYSFQQSIKQSRASVKAMCLQQIVYWENPRCVCALACLRSPASPRFSSKSKDQLVFASSKVKKEFVSLAIPFFLDSGDLQKFSFHQL